MDAAIDIGSNTIRMLISSDFHDGKLPSRYYRQITRLAGDFTEQVGLSESGMDRSLLVLQSYQKIISSQNVSRVKVVGTAALRRARNQQFFVNKVYASTGLKIEIIDGAEEAMLATQGVLSVVDPMPDAAIILDIGGGSTELACIIEGKVHFQQSFPLGVVRLCEEFSSAAQRQQQIDTTFKSFPESLQQLELAGKKYQLIGTAGTITTLAAIHLHLHEYDVEQINNHYLSRDWLSILEKKLKLMKTPEIDNLIGMEPGRGDLILPGLEIVLFILNQLQLTSLRVSDSGLLEGVMLNLTDS